MGITLLGMKGIIHLSRCLTLSTCAWLMIDNAALREVLWHMLNVRPLSSSTEVIYLLACLRLHIDTEPKIPVCVYLIETC